MEKKKSKKKLIEVASFGMSTYGKSSILVGSPKKQVGYTWKKPKSHLSLYREFLKTYWKVAERESRTRTVEVSHEHFPMYLDWLTKNPGATKSEMREAIAKLV